MMLMLLLVVLHWLLCPSACAVAVCDFISKRYLRTEKAFGTTVASITRTMRALRFLETVFNCCKNCKKTVKNRPEMSRKVTGFLST